MEAKDTVMSYDQMTDIEESIEDAVFSGRETPSKLYAVAEAQAEITFNLRTNDILHQLKGFNQRGLPITEAIYLLQ